MEGQLILKKNTFLEHPVCLLTKFIDGTDLDLDDLVGGLGDPGPGVKGVLDNQVLAPLG